MCAELCTPETGHTHLPRLAPAHYRGFAFVHWIMTTQERRTGWLTPALHHATRELLLHTLCRYQLTCPIYCLMPDHAHFVWLGLTPSSDQLRASRFFRMHWSPLLTPAKLQKQAYDHVLNAEEREQGAFRLAAQYVRENPVRKKLVVDPLLYPFSGAMFPGFPDLDWRAEDYWDRFWRAYASARRT